SPTIFTRRITRSRGAHHRIERSRTLLPKARKCALASATRSFSVISGRQRERLVRQTLRRSRPRMYRSEPRAEPIGASRARGKRCSIQATATAIRVSKAGSLLPRIRRQHPRRHFVAVVAPQVLLGMAANQPLERAVEGAHRRFGRPRREHRFREEAIAAPPGQTLGATQQHGG